MIPLSALGGGARPNGGMGAGMRPPAGGGGMIPLGSLGGGMGGPNMSPPSMQPPSMSPPSMVPPSMTPPDMMPPPGGPGDANGTLGGMLGGNGFQPQTNAAPTAFTPGDPNNPNNDTLAEVGKSAKDYLDVLMPIAIPTEGEDERPVPKAVQCLEDGTDLFKMFDVDMHRFDPKAVRKTFHKMNALVDPKKLGRESSAADKARFTKLKQAYTVVMDDTLRAVYRQHCFGIAGSGGCAALGHEAALAHSLTMGRDLRKMGEDRAIVLHKAAEVGWANETKDKDGRLMSSKNIGDGSKIATQFNLFGDISSEEDDNPELEKERRSMTPEDIIAKSPKYADTFLEKVKLILLDKYVSNPAAGGAFTMHENPKLMDMLNDNPKTVQKNIRKIRTTVKQMNWAMTALLQHKESPWRGMEVKGSIAENSIIKLLEIIKSGIAMGKFNEVHEQDLSKVIDSLHRLYMDIFEKRGQELLRAAIAAELAVVYLLPESGGRLPDGTRVHLQDFVSRPDLNGKSGLISGWDYALQRYTVTLEKADDKKNKTAAPLNPDLLGLDDVDEEEDVAAEDNKPIENIPKKIMVMPKNALVDLEIPKGRLDALVKMWNAWRRRPRSVSASQDAEAVASALGPPLESMAGYLQEAASAVGTGAACGKDGADLIAFECREALQGARNLAAKLLGEEPEEPSPPPPMNEPAQLAVQVDAVSQALKEAAEVAAASLELKAALKDGKDEKRKKSRSRSRKRRRRRSSSSD